MTVVRMAYNEFNPIPKQKTEIQRPPVIVLHGLYWNKDMYTDLSQLLAETLQRTVYALDLRNHFDSPAPKDCSCELMVKDLEFFMKEHDITQASFICHSFSASVAHMLGIKNPKAIEKLVLVDRAPYLDDKEEYMKSCRMQLHGQNRFLFQLNSNMPLQAAKFKFENYKCETDGQKIFMKKVAADLIKKNGKFTWKTDLDFLYKKAEEGDLRPGEYKGTYDGEILIVRGSKSDRVTDEVFRSVLKLNPKSKLLTIEDTTHMVMLEVPFRFAKEMRKFLNEGK